MLWGLEFSQTSKYSYISNELFYFVLNAQFIPTATEQCVIFNPSPAQCFEQCLRSIGTVELFLQRCISLCPAISQEPLFLPQSINHLSYVELQQLFRACIFLDACICFMGVILVLESFSFLISKVNTSIPFSLDELLQSHFNVTCIRLYPKPTMWVSFFMFFDCLDLKTNKYC